MENSEKIRLGRFKDRVQLHTWIFAAQDRSLTRICQIRDIDRTEAVTEALQFWIHKNEIALEQHAETANAGT